MEEHLGDRKKSRISSTVPPCLQVTAAWHKATPQDEIAQHGPYTRSREIHPLPCVRWKCGATTITTSY